MIVNSGFSQKENPRPSKENSNKDFSEEAKCFESHLSSISMKRNLRLKEIRSVSAKISDLKISNSKKLAKIQNLHQVVKSLKDNFHMK